MKVSKPIDVTYDSTDNLDTAAVWLAELDNTNEPVGLDFEAAVHHSAEDLTSYKEQLENPDLDFFEAIDLRQNLKATALSHPSHSFPTHLSIGITESYGKVIIITTYEMLNLVMNWLVTTTTKQVWHNASYDFKHIFFHTTAFPKNYEDTAQLAKSILNHVDTWKAKVGLKELAGDWYGGWAISVDYFTIDEIYNDKVLKYAATDGCATIRLWNSILTFLKEQE